MKILHLEDSIIHMATVREVLHLTHPAWELKQISSMKEAEQAYAHERFDVVLCDARIEHDEDGTDFAERLNRQGQKVIITSAYADNERPGIPFVAKQTMRADLVPTIIETAAPKPAAVPAAAAAALA